MNPRELEHLFGEWRQLTEAEGRAISGDDWTEVRRQQERKEELQTRLVRATDAGRILGAGPSANRADFERRFRPVITELVAMEMTNAQLVATRRASARREFAECDRAAGNLRGLTRAYGAAVGGHWTSYS